MKERLNPYEQKTDYTCGPASLLIAYRLLGRNYNEEVLAVELGTTKKGTDWEQMISHPAKLGYKVEFKANATWANLVSALKRGVVIVGWEADDDGAPEGHFSVIKSIAGNLIEIANPGLPPDEWPEIIDKTAFLGKWRDEEMPRAMLIIKRPS